MLPHRWMPGEFLFLARERTKAEDWPAAPTATESTTPERCNATNAATALLAIHHLAPAVTSSARTRSAGWTSRAARLPKRAGDRPRLLLDEAGRANLVAHLDWR
jgi:hypothetical protein